MKNAKVFVPILLLVVMAFCLVACGDTTVQDEQTFTIYFYPNNGSTIDSITIRTGETIVLPPNPTMEGFTFAGWMIDEEMKTAFEEGQAITSDIFLYAKWEPYGDSTEYSLTFMVDGTVYASYELLPSTTITLPNTPTKQCYLFAGWSLDENSNMLFDDTQMLYENITLYAMWEENHTPVKDVGYEATCTTDGLSDGYHCEICNICITVQQTIPATGHAGGEETCEHGKICTTCGTEYTQALGHIGGKATCTKKATCTRCGNGYGNVLGHDIVNHAAKEPTCTEAGWYAYETCTRCDHTTYQERKALGHDEIPHAGQDPTCTKDGWEAYVTCTRCDHTTYKKIDALGHGTINHAAKEPTCEEDGWYAYETCSRCDHTTYQERKALGHDEIPHAGQDPTCTKDGWEAYVTCTRCDHTTYKKIDALGHDEISHAAKKQTCTEIGWDVYVTCSRCDYTTYKEIPCHNYDEYEHCITCGYFDSGLLLELNSDGKTYSVVGIREDYTVTNIEIPTANYDTTPIVVTTITDNAFSGTNIETIVLSDSVTTIGANAFANCASLAGILLADGVRFIGENAFLNCTALTEVVVFETDNWLQIEYENEYSNPLCYDADLYIMDMDLGYEVAVKEITIPRKVEDVDFDVLATCKSLEKVNVETGHINYQSKDGVVYDAIGENILFVPVKLNGNIELLKGITKIEDYTFSGMDIETIIISDSVTAIGANAFADCASLIGILLADGVESIGENAFLNCRALEIVAFFSTDSWLKITYTSECSNPLCYGGNLYVVDKQLDNEVLVKEITIPTTVENVDFDVLATCKSLEKVNVENGHINYQSQDGVVYDAVGENILFVPPMLKGVVELLYGLRRIGEYAFAERIDLTKIIVPYSVTEICEGAFNGCESLKHVEIEYLDAVIGNNAFCGVANGVTLEGSIGVVKELIKATDVLSYNIIIIYATSITSSDFAGDTKLVGIVIPDKVGTIAKGAFSGCSNLESITVPFVGGDEDASSASKSTLFGYIFGDTRYDGSIETKQSYSMTISTTYYYIPASLKNVTVQGGTIYYGAFMNCANIVCVTIGEDVTKIGNNTFSNCSSLTTVNWNALECKGTLTTAVLCDFSNCDNFTILNFGEKVTRIPEYTFRLCENLTSLTIGGEVTSIGDYAFV